MNFADVARVFDQLETISSRLEITRLIADLFARVTPDEAAIISYLSLGQLRPVYQANQLNMAEKNVIKAIALLVGESVETIAAQLKQSGDVGLVVMEYKWSTDHHLSIGQVHEALVEIEKVSGAGSQELKISMLKNILAMLDPLSAKYVLRMVVGRLRLGFSDMTLIDALSWMIAGDKSHRKEIEQAYNICADIGRIARELKKDGLPAIGRQKIRINTPILPAAAERLPTAQAIFEKLGPCVVQQKLDGFRLQIHLDKSGKEPKIAFFSRNLLDMSSMFPDLAHEVMRLEVKNLVAEGEAIAFDPHTQEFMPFQETVKRKRKHDIESISQEFPLQLFLFDVLYCNDTSLLDIPHHDRRKILEAVVPAVKDSLIRVIDEKKVESAQDLETYFYTCIEKGLEGLVAKRPDAVYQPGKRNFNWIKLKRQEEGHLEDTLDCVVLGYYTGQGKRNSFGIGAFLVGVYNKERDIFQTVARIGTGLTDAEWKELKIKADLIAIANQPTNVECHKNLAPDVWVEPKIVCSIRADEITLSPVHTAAKTDRHLGYALRFPRVMGYRPDKSLYDASTTTEVARMYEDQFAK